MPDRDFSTDGKIVSMEGIDNSELVRGLLKIPVFREIYNLLHSSTKPVDWKLAEQISDAVAGAGLRTARPGAADLEELHQACRIAELAVVGSSGLGPVRGITDVRLLWRQQWAQFNLDAMRPLSERLASRLSGSSVAAQPFAPARPVVDSVGPLVLGAQFGLVFGYLAHKALTLWDFCLPRNQPGRLYFNYPNIVEVESELQVGSREFRMWLAISEVAHELAFQSIVWTRPYLTRLVEQYVDLAELDASELAAKVQTLTDPQELLPLLQHPEDLLPMLRTSAQEVTAEKIECFLGLVEGYCDWICRKAGLSLVGEFEKIREGMRRRAAERSSAERMLEKLFGVDLSLQTRRSSERFIAAIADAGLIDVLWSKVENLPTIDELAQPERWISRVGVR
jgi:putative hydrolase